jgi:hypothetical protein
VTRSGIVGRSLTMKGESAIGRIWLTDLLSKAGAPTVSGPKAGGAGPPTWFPPPVEYPG